MLSDPSDIGAKVEFVALYHMVIEGTLALPGQYFQTDNLEKRGILPGHLKAFEYEYLGYSSQSMNEFAFTALSRRLKVIGVGLPAVAG